VERAFRPAPGSANLYGLLTKEVPSMRGKYQNGNKLYFRNNPVLQAEEKG